MSKAPLPQNYEELLQKFVLKCREESRQHYDEMLRKFVLKCRTEQSNTQTVKVYGDYNKVLQRQIDLNEYKQYYQKCRVDLGQIAPYTKYTGY
jgi:hypothetical protein